MDYAELKEEMKNAMKAKDKDRLAIIRQVKGDVDATVKDEGRDEVTEQDVTASLKRTLKQARETHEASVKAGTDEERTQRLAAQIERASNSRLWSRRPSSRPARLRCATWARSWARSPRRPMAISTRAPLRRSQRRSSARKQCGRASWRMSRWPAAHPPLLRQR